MNMHAMKTEPDTAAIATTAAPVVATAASE